MLSAAAPAFDFCDRLSLRRFASGSWHNGWWLKQPWLTIPYCNCIINPNPCIWLLTIVGSCWLLNLNDIIAAANDDPWINHLDRTTVSPEMCDSTGRVIRHCFLQVASSKGVCPMRRVSDPPNVYMQMHRWSLAYPQIVPRNKPLQNCNVPGCKYTYSIDMGLSINAGTSHCLCIKGDASNVSLHMSCQWIPRNADSICLMTVLICIDREHDDVHLNMILLAAEDCNHYV